MSLEQVVLVGQVHRPGKYEFGVGAVQKLSELIEAAGGVIPTEKPLLIELVRRTPGGLRRISLDYNLLVESKSNHDLFLRSNDRIAVRFRR